MMEKQFARHRLGNNGPDVSRLCLSARMFGNGTETSEAVDLIERYREAGGNFINAAGAGLDGAAERIVGRTLRGGRDRLIIAAAAAGPPPTSKPNSSGSDHWLRQAIDASRDRLQVDKIDLYYLCFDDCMGRVEETIEVIGEMMEAGKIGGWGVSDLRAWRIAELVRIADCLEVARPTAAQCYYHALYRLTEVEYLPAYAHFGIGVVAYAPLARGMLSEEFSCDIKYPAYVGRQDPVVMDATCRPAAMHAVRAIARHLQPSGRAMTGFALQWVLANRLVTSVLIRPRSLAQLESYLRADETSYTPTDEAFMNELVPSGHFVGTAYRPMQSAQAGRVLA